MIKLLKIKHTLKICFQNSQFNNIFCEVLKTPVNTPIDSSNVLQELKKVYASIGITDKTFHDLRHTYATRLFELGEPAKTVQELLGHSNVSQTLGTYTHVLEQQKIKTASLIDALYDPPQKTNVISIG
ncbi:MULTISPECIES: tyrosine-type recombinase/integrase [Acetobacterium]|uniref:tyrosine-type recombinase/integrase n=1 Tax=Acetobacterium TaxID=33951 RepID=UPI000B9C8EE0|nr:MULTISPECIES: tyrosine-type recombinase/integrase [Acetobacterium]MEA4805364.1 tyrosine-type recombinase/integrase [Acetobacterium wieringae]OXS26424.1 MAG: hypothetical protein BI182_15185 [Acetobacterium sp. MES1]